jgi:hypothetical protein
LWATLAIACAAAASLVAIPLIFGWRTIFSRNPGKFRTIVYFACLGAGYIMVEVGLISEFMLALSNATVSASVLITGMLVFSGLGAFLSERYLDRARSIMPRIFGNRRHPDRLRPFSRSCVPISACPLSPAPRFSSRSSSRRPS